MTTAPRSTTIGSMSKKLTPPDSNCSLVSTEKALELWEKRVFDCSEEIDPDDSYDWWDMAYGFFLGLQFPPEVAANLANEAKLF